MQRLISALALLLLAGGALAAPKPCAELKEEIEVKIQANKVTSYTLEIVPSDEVTDPSMVVGSCEAGSRKIIDQNNC